MSCFMWTNFHHIQFVISVAPGQGFVDARHLLFKHIADFPSHSEINKEKKGMFKVSVFLLLL